MQPTGTLATLLGPELDVELQIHWAVSLAKARNLDFLVLHRVQSQEDRTVEVVLDESPVESGASGYCQFNSGLADWAA